MAVLALTPTWKIERSEKPLDLSARLGDGYEQSILIKDPAPSWQLTSFFPSLAALNTTLDTLRLYQGATAFQWSPDGGSILPLRDCVCESWNYSRLAENLWKIEATFFEVP